MKLSAFILPAIVMSLTTSACSIFQIPTVVTNPSASQASTSSPKNQQQDASLLDEQQTASLIGCWSITSVNGKNVVVNGDNHPQITFKAIPEAKTGVLVIVNNGCNYLNGSWTVTGTKLEANGEFVSSLRACPDAPYESAINQAVNQTASYSIVDANTITLNSAAGHSLMTLRRCNLSFLNGAWRITTISGQSVPSNTNIKVVIDVDECKIHGNAGCNIVNGTIVVNLDKGDGIEFKDLATTRMTCPAIATEQAFLLALEQVDTCVEGTSSDQAVMKGTDGQTLLTLVRISPDQLNEE